MYVTRLAVIGGLTLLVGVSLGIKECPPITTCNPSAWRTVDQYQKAANNQSSIFGMASFQTSQYAVGSAYDGSNYYWTVRRSTDRGETWSTVDEIKDATATGVAIDPKNGNVYVVGRFQAKNATEPNAWVVRKSIDGGTTWSTVDQIQASGNTPAPLASRIAIDGASHLSVIGFYDTGSMYGLLRRSEDGGASWTWIDYANSEQSFPEAIVASSDGKVFIGGGLYGGSQSSGPFHSWSVRYSPDGKSGWVTVDTYPSGSITNSTDAFPLHAAISDDGRVSFAGYNGGDWLVRIAELANPTLWTTFDTIHIQNAGLSAKGIVFSKSNEAFVIGHQLMQANPVVSTVIARRGNPPAIPFSQTDQTVEPSALAGEAIPPIFNGTGAASRDDLGNILLGTDYITSHNISWTIRKLGCG